MSDQPKKRDANDVASTTGLPDTETVLKQAQPVPCRQALLWDHELLNQYPETRPAIIDGMLREGETMNIIAPPKRGKSWMVGGMAYAVSQGIPWMGFNTNQTNVLVIDNELHRETLAYRVKRIRRAQNVEGFGKVAFMPLRGVLKDIKKIGDDLDVWLPGSDFKLIILDAFYRFIPEGSKEEDNSQMAAIYNLIDSYADRHNCAFVAVHHTSKGLQAGKAVTDVGSGAGSMSRAVDCHLVLRAHREENCVTLEAAARSFPPIEKKVIRFDTESLTWSLEPNLDPTDLDDGKPKKDKPKIESLNLKAFVAAYITENPEPGAIIKARAMEAGYTHRTVDLLMSRIKLGEICGAYSMDIKRTGRGAPPTYYCTNKQALTEMFNNVNS